MTASAQSAGQALIIDAVTHRYGTAFAVDNVTLDIKEGELIKVDTRTGSYMGRA